MSLESIYPTSCLRLLMACAILVLVPAFLLPVGAAAQGAGDAAALGPGLHRLTLQRDDGPAVNYAIQIPDNYSPSRPVPLVLALHFGGNPAGAVASLLEILVGPALADLGAIIVAPDSVRGNSSTPENESAVNALLDMVIANYAIDEEKIAVTGYSMGGSGAWHFGQKFPERFSAAIPIAGQPPASAAGWHLPVLAIHSRFDEVSPFLPTEIRISELQNAGADATLIAVDGITHYQTYRFQDALRQAVPWLREHWE